MSITKDIMDPLGIGRSSPKKVTANTPNVQLFTVVGFGPEVAKTTLVRGALIIVGIIVILMGIHQLTKASSGPIDVVVNPVSTVGGKVTRYAVGNAKGRVKAARQTRASRKSASNSKAPAKPVAKKPAAKKPAAKKPAVKKPAAKKPAAEKSVVKSAVEAAPEAVG